MNGESEKAIKAHIAEVNSNRDSECYECHKPITDSNWEVAHQDDTGKWLCLCRECFEKSREKDIFDHMEKVNE